MILDGPLPSWHRSHRRTRLWIHPPSKLLQPMTRKLIKPPLTAYLPILAGNLVRRPRLTYSPSLDLARWDEPSRTGSPSSSMSPWLIRITTRQSPRSLPLPLPVVSPALEHLETPVVYASIALALVGLAGAAFFFGDAGKRADALRDRFAGVHRLLSGKYYVDEAYDTLIGRPLHWISERVFLRLGDQILLDGSLHGLAALARRTAGALGRVQTGNLQLYAFFVLIGIVASLAWGWRHG